MKLFVTNFIYILVFVLILSVCEDANAARILFVGNSFTGFSAQILQDFAQASPFGEDQLEFQLVGGTSLQAHASRNQTLKAIQCERFDYIVLQDHSQRTLLDPSSFTFGVSSLVSMARASGAQPILFETWARGRGGNLNSFLFHQSIVSNAYHDISAQLNVPIVHVGDVWREVHRVNKSLFATLYRPDLIHPSRAGQYAVAASVYRTLYPTDLTWAPSNGLSGGSQVTIRNIARNFNSPLPLYQNPNRRNICDVSRDDAQRALCGCTGRKPVVVSPILDLLLN